MRPSPPRALSPSARTRVNSDIASSIVKCPTATRACNAPSQEVTCVHVRPTGQLTGVRRLNCPTGRMRLAPGGTSESLQTVPRRVPLLGRSGRRTTGSYHSTAGRTLDRPGQPLQERHGHRPDCVLGQRVEPRPGACNVGRPSLSPPALHRRPRPPRAPSHRRP